MKLIRFCYGKLNYKTILETLDAQEISGEGVTAVICEWFDASAIKLIKNYFACRGYIVLLG